MTMTADELRAAIEAILFVSGEPVKFEELTEAFPDQEKEILEQQINEIESSFAQRGGGFILERAAGGFRFATRPDLDPHLRKYFSRKNEGRLSLAALETMAIVAYRQPITVPEINDIRGVNSSSVIPGSRESSSRPQLQRADPQPTGCGEGKPGIAGTGAVDWAACCRASGIVSPPTASGGIAT